MIRNNKLKGNAMKKRITFDTAPELLTPQQAQELLQIASAKFYRMVKKNQLPGAFKVGNSWRVNRDTLKAWIDSQAQD